ncbi:MAG: hypothetical protein NTW38_05700 [Candidatus Aminicenantes bacterium]|nr:hypothetical protein [Candidatus Aminicenantes bacterium]
MVKISARIFTFIFVLISVTLSTSFYGGKSPRVPDQTPCPQQDFSTPENDATAASPLWIRGFRGFFAVIPEPKLELCRFIDVQPADDGGFVAAGYTQLFTYNPDHDYYEALIMKINSFGEVVWKVLFPPDLNADTNLCGLNSLIRTKDGGYLAVGFISKGNGQSKVLLMKIERAGMVKWIKSYGGNSLDSGYQAIENNDGGFTVAASTSSFQSQGTDIWIFKVNSYGDMIWQRALGTAMADEPSSIQATPDGGSIVVGSSWNGYGRAFALRLNGNGTVKWYKTYFEAGYFNDHSYDSEFNSVVCEPNGTFIIAGKSGVACCDDQSNNKPWLLKLNSSGDLIWQRGINSEFSIPTDLIKTRDGGYFMTAYNAVYKIDAAGFTQWGRIYSNSNVGIGAVAVSQKNDGGYLLVGELWSSDKYYLLAMSLGPGAGTGSLNCGLAQGASVGSWVPVATFKPANYKIRQTKATVHRLTYTPYARSFTVRKICG